MTKELIVVKGKVIEQQRAFTAEVGKNINYEEGAKMVKRHFDQHPDEVMASFIGKNIIERIFAQPGCVGLRIFNALDEIGIKKLVFVGVDANGNNILQIDSIKKGEIAAGVVLCPPYCGVATETESTESSWW